MMKKEGLLLCLLVLSGCTSSRTVTWDDVSTHDSLDDCWIIMKGQVFDVSENSDKFVTSCGGELIRPEFNGTKPEGSDRGSKGEFIGEYIGNIE